jgi:hypothetical protein
MANDVIITPASGRIQFIKDTGQALLPYNIDLSSGSGLIIDSAFTSSIGIKAPNIADLSGSNTFLGTNTFNGATTINGNLSVFGATNIFSASNIYITSSNLTVTDNILLMNALTPYQRYAGIQMYDSGSGTLSHLLWDGQGDYFFLSGSGINSKIIGGPDGQGNLSAGYIPKTTGVNILGNSIIYDTGGGIGINTNSPTAKLEVYGGSLPTAIGSSSIIASFSTANSNSSYLRIIESRFDTGTGWDTARTRIQKTTDVTDQAYIEFNPSGSQYGLAFGTGIAVEKVRIDSSGNVGIGTTSPISLLDVRSGYVTAGTITATNGPKILAGYYSNGHLTTLGSEYSSGGPVLGYGVWPSTGSAAAFLSSTGINAYRSAYIQDGATHRWYNTNAASTVSIGSLVTLTERMRISAAGYVGIGTTNPLAPLVVSNGSSENIEFNSGNVTYNGGVLEYINRNSATTRPDFNFFLNSAGGGDFKFYTGGANERLRITSAGNVGIGTTSPTSKLTVTTTVATSSVFNVQGTNGTLFNVIDDLSDSLMSVNNGAGLPVLEVFADDRLIAGQYNQNDFVIVNNNVGIGTNNPSAKLTVTSSAATPSAVFLGGNVGIGTTSPSVRLHVSGSSYFQGFARVNLTQNNTIGTSGGSGNLQVNSINIHPDSTTETMYIRQLSTGIYQLQTAIDNVNSGSLNLQPYGGNVSIGTTSPSAKLHVVGSSILATGTTINPDSYAAIVAGNIADGSGWGVLGIGGNNGNTGRSFGMGVSGTTFYMGFQNGSTSSSMQTFLLVSGSRNVGLVPDGGNVGIGNTSPVTKLDVVGSNASFPATSSATQNTGSILRLRNINSNLVLDIGGNGGNGNWLQSTNQTDLSLNYPLLLNPNGGSVGIGTTSPSAKLQINDAGDKAYLILNTTSSVNKRVRLQFTQNNNAGIELGSDLSIDNTTNLYFYDRVNAQLIAFFSSSNSYFNTGLGIGGISPTSKLHVVETTKTGSRIQLTTNANDALMNANATNDLLILNAPYGTNPGTTANAGAKWGIKFVGATDTLLNVNTKASAIYAVSEDTLGYNRGTSLAFYTNQLADGVYAERMRIFHNGNVGIGTTSPAYLLDVSGSSRFGSSTSDTHRFTGSVNFGGSITTPVIKQSTTLYTGTDITDDDSTRTVYFNIPPGGNNPPKYFKVARIKITGNYQNVSLNGYFTVTNSTGLHVGSERKIEFDFIAYAATNPGAPIVTYLKRGPDTTTVLVYAVPNGGGAGTTYYDVYITSGWYNDTNGELAIRVGYSSAVTIWQAGLDSGTSAPTDTLVNPNSNYAFDTSGNVGIGFTNPAQKLHVSGSIRYTSNSNLSVTEYAGIIDTPDDFPTCTEKARIYTIGTINADGGYNSYIEIEAIGSHRGYTPDSYYEYKKWIITVGDRISSRLIFSSGENKVGLWNGTDATGFKGQNGAPDLANGAVLKLIVNPNCGANFSYTVKVKYSNLNLTHGPFTYISHSVQTVTIPISQYHLYGDTVSLALNTGNVGIGTTTPLAKLHVAGNISGSSFTSSVSNAVGFLGTSSWAVNVTGTAGSETLSTVTGRGNSTGTQIVVSTAAGQAMYVGRQAGAGYSYGSAGIFTALSDNPTGSLNSFFAGFISSSSTIPGGINTYSVRADGLINTTFNSATGLANNSFDVAKTILGALHIANGAGTSGDNRQAAITFQGGSASQAQAGIYVSNNNSTGTAMAFATTDNYGAGPQIFMTAINSGIVNFPRNYVGIGTSSPRASLHVNTVTGSAATEYAGLVVSATVSSSRGVNISYDVANDVGAIASVHNGVAWKNLTLQPVDGNVGITTFSPLFKLSVSTTFNAGGPFVISGPANSNTYYDQGLGAYYHTPGAMIRVDSAASSSAHAPATLVLYNKNGTDNTSTKLVFANNETTATNANPVATAAITSEKVSGVANNWARGNLKFLVKSGSLYTDAAIIDANGNFGVGVLSNLQPIGVGSTSATTLGLLRTGVQAIGGNIGPSINFYLAQSATTSLTGDVNFGRITVNPIDSWGGRMLFFTKTADGNNTTAPTEKMRISEQGYVGIGTGSFVYGAANRGLLEIYGSTDSLIGLKNSTNNAYIQKSGNDFYLNNGGAGIIYFQNNGSNRVIIDSNGNVGIGTTSPLGKTHIYGFLRVGGAANDQTGTIALGNDTHPTSTYGDNGMFRGGIGSIGSGNYTNISSYQGIVFNVSAAGFGSQSTRMLIDINGNVGIGTVNPSASLHINSTTSGATLLRTNGTNGTLFSVIDDLSDSLMSVNNGAGLPVLEVFADDRLVAGQYNQNDFVIVNNKVGIGTNNPSGKLTITSSTATPSAVFLGGNVGIGTTVPNNPLHVYSNNNQPILLQGTTAGAWMDFQSSTSNLMSFGVDGTRGFAFYNRTTSAYLMTISSSGNIGIGNITPGQKLSVQGEISKYTSTGIDGTFDNFIKYGHFADLQSGASNTNRWIGFDASITAGAAVSNVLRARSFGGGNNNNAPVNIVDFRGDQTSYFYGNVGIGTTPGSVVKFAVSDGTTVAQINPSSNVAYFGTVNNYPIAFSVNSQEVVRIDTSGNLGIGTTSPTNFLNSNTTYFRPSGSGEFLTIYSSTSEAVINLITSGSGDGFPVGGIYFTRQRGQGDAHHQIAAIKALQDGTLGTGANLAGGALQFFTKANGGGTGFDAPAMVIKTNSYVGIGTTGPSEVLDVRGNIKLGATNSGSFIYYLKDTEGTIVKTQRSDTSQEGLFRSDGWGNFTFNKSIGVGYSIGAGPITGNIFASGNVGIGTNTSSAKLSVNSSGSLAAGSVVFRVEGTSGSLFSVDDTLSGSLMSVNDISGLPILEVFSDNRVVMGTFNANTLVVTGSNVGIGSASPAVKFDVNGTAKVTTLGISVSPSNRLHVNGDGTNPAIRIDNGALVTGVSSTSKNTFQGYLPISFGGTTYFIRLWT